MSKEYYEQWSDLRESEFDLDDELDDEYTPSPEEEEEEEEEESLSGVV